MSKINIDEIKEAKRKLNEAKMTLFNARLDAANASQNEKEMEATLAEPINSGCNFVAGCGVKPSEMQ